MPKAMTEKKHIKGTLLLPILNLLVSVIAVLLMVGIAYHDSQAKMKSLGGYLEAKFYYRNNDFPKFLPEQIRIKNKLVENAVSLKIRILNLGDNILIEDYCSPIEVNFKNIVEILDARIVDRVPADVGCDITFSPQQIVISEALLNHNDSFTIEVVCSITSEADEFVDNIKGRIKGLHQIRYYKASTVSENWVWIKWRFVLIVFLLYPFLVIWRITDAYAYRHKTSMELCMYIGAVMILLLWLLDPILSIFNMK